MKKLMHATGSNEITEISLGDLFPEMDAKNCEELANVPNFA
jgi:hypothetical protein